MKQDFLAKSFSLPSLSTVEYSSGYLFFISYWKTIVVYKSNKNREKLDHCKREEMVLWEDMSLLAVKSLYEEKGNAGYLWSEAYTLNVVCYEDNYLNYLIVCTTERTLFLQQVRFLCLPCVSCGQRM